MAIVLDGKAIAARLKSELHAETIELLKRGVRPGLAVVLVGDDPASQLYMKRLIDTAASLGIAGYPTMLSPLTPRPVHEAVIKQLNENTGVHAIIQMMPLPGHLDPQWVADIISPAKDVDSISPVNLGHLLSGQGTIAPCTPRAVMEILKQSNIDIAGKHAVVVGRSNVVGKPLSMLLIKENATVTVCHSRTTDLKSITSQADILIVAIGRSGFIKADMVKPGAVVVDVGINVIGGVISGDVDFASVSQVAGAITPVPGGVGSVSSTMVMKATIECARKLA